MSGIFSRCFFRRNDLNFWCETVYNSAIMEKSGGNCAANLSFCGAEAASSAGKGGTIISKTAETWHEAAMHFALDLAKDSENFPKKVLALFDKHFGFRRSIFFPYQYPAFLGGGGPGGATR